MARHNKKRNVGLVYEFLVQAASEAIVEGNDAKRDEILSIIRKHFAQNTELYREFRLFHSLAATTVESEQVADTILEAAKSAARQYNEHQLDHEKSILIRNINHRLQNTDFYNKRLDEYTIYATIQTLLNEWRRDIPSDIVKMAQFEQTLREWLLKEKTVATVDEIDDADPLVEKLMLKKFNERYKDQLTQEQAALLKSYISNSQDVQAQISDLKESTLNEIDNYLQEHSGKNKFLANKLTQAKKVITETKTDEVNDVVVERFLDIAKLKNEITHEE